MTPDHGTRGAYWRGCRCPDCRHAETVGKKRWRMHQGRPRVIDATEVAEHLDALTRSGLRMREVVDESGVNHRTVTKVRSREQLRIRVDVAARLLAVDPLPDPATVVDNVAVERVLTGHAPLDTLNRAEVHAVRREAARRGWTASEITRHLGISGTRARQIMAEVAS